MFLVAKIQNILPLSPKTPTRVSRTLFRYKSKYKKVGVLPIRIEKSNVWSIGSSSERNREQSLWQRANARNVRLFYPYWQYTDLFIFRFVSKLHLYSTYAAHYAVYFYLDIHGIKLIFYFLNLSDARMVSIEHKYWDTNIPKTHVDKVEVIKLTMIAYLGEKLHIANTNGTQNSIQLIFRDIFPIFGNCISFVCVNRWSCLIINHLIFAFFQKPKYLYNKMICHELLSIVIMNCYLFNVMKSILYIING